MTKQVRLNMVTQITNFLIVYIVWIYVMGIKRLELQIAQDEYENTYNIFKKLRCANQFNITFMSLILLF